MVRRRFAGPAMILCLLLQGASVQTPPPADEAAPDEVIVTATRDARPLGRVPVSVAAPTGEELERARLRDLDDLARATPGLSVRQGFGGAREFSIRGITSSVGTATAGILIDDTPIQVRSLGAADLFAPPLPELWDLERAEVLRGPGGTLFGTGSEGGTIRLLTPRPSLSDVHTHSRASLGLTDGAGPQRFAGLALGGPLIPGRLGLRLSAASRDEGGWIDRRPVTGADRTPRRDTNDERARVSQAQLAWAPAPGWLLTPGMLAQERREADSAQYWERLSDPDGGRFISGAPLRQPVRDGFLLPSIRLEGALGNEVRLLGNASWLRRRVDATLDYSLLVVEGLTRGALSVVPGVPDFTAASRFRLTQDGNTQELRLLRDGMVLDWTVGLFRNRQVQRVGQELTSERFADFARAVLGCPAPALCFGQDVLPGDVAYRGRDGARDLSLAAFGQLDWTFAPDLTVTAGARLSRDENRSENAQQGPFNFGPSASAGRVAETRLNPRLGLSWQRGRTLLYASAASGTRPGGGNPAVPGALCAADLRALGLQAVPRTYGGDRVRSLEAGAKTRLGGTRVAAALFGADWTGLQQAVLLPNCGFGYTANLGRAASTGAELEVDGEITSFLRLSASVSLTHARNTRTARTAAGTLLATRGDRLPVPPVEWRLSAVATLDQIGVRNGEVQLDWDHEEDYARAPSGPAFGADPFNARQGDVDLVGLRARAPWGGWQASLFVDNLLNTADPLLRTRDSPFAPTFRKVSPRPRTIGVELRTGW